MTVIALACGVESMHFAVAKESATDASSTVYVTGSNLKRTSKESSSPVTVITAKDIKNIGATTGVQPDETGAVDGGGQQQRRQQRQRLRERAATASLRGLGSASTLILLNGRRMTPAPYADPNDGNSVLYDLNSIPISAIERIEILQDGASAIYGADAIAGVINFILKTNLNGA